MISLVKGPVLRLSVSPDDHSHLIGKKGLAHKHLQASTDTLVHFPDKAHASSKVLDLQAEDEVILMPASAKLKSLPWSFEGELVQQFADCRKQIRQNQLLIYRLVVPNPTLDQERVQKFCSIAGKASNEGIVVSSHKLSDHHVVIVRGIMAQSSSVVQIATELQTLFSCALYTTMHLASTHWPDIITLAGSQVIKEFELPDAAPDAALASFLCTIGVLLQFHQDGMVCLSGMDAAGVLDVRQRLTTALPISLILQVSASDRSAFTCNVENSQVVANLLKLCGVRLASLNKISGQRVILETHEANFAALFEARWLLSQDGVGGLLDRWARMRDLWPAGCELPACLRSLRAFAQLEEESSQPEPTTTTAMPFELSFIGDLSQSFGSACRLASGGPALQLPGDLADSGLGQSALGDSLLLG